MVLITDYINLSALAHILSPKAVFCKCSIVLPTLTGTSVAINYDRDYVFLVIVTNIFSKFWGHKSLNYNTHIYNLNLTML